jgi:hypothetical protein
MDGLDHAPFFPRSQYDLGDPMFKPPIHEMYRSSNIIRSNSRHDQRDCHTGSGSINA